MNQRVDGLLAQLRERNLDAVIVSTPENRRYLSGFTGSAGYLLITPDLRLLFTDSRYTQQAAQQSPDFQVRPTRQGWESLVCALGQAGAQRVGFESENLSVAAYQRLLDCLKEAGTLDGVSLVPTVGLVEELRSVKDEEELARLQRAIDASDAAMAAVVPSITEGMTEREVAWRMEQAMRDAGADGPSFSTIVAAGPNSAMPHHRPTERPIQQGEPVVIDMGARVEGIAATSPAPWWSAGPTKPFGGFMTLCWERS